ncbi:fic family toxin-antitoxin system, toxin component [Streptomyces sp. Ac-502]|uniref:fic family toxin-antitoxin system, toxin component n=1 Tax=Streptomyces sp. Ac-502 TaxID=3342801 RepID=UPI003862B9CB
MPFILTIDEAWLLEVAQTYLPGDPDVTDFGALAAAAARHRHEVMGTLVYTEARHRAAALLHSLVRVPALEHSNETFAVAVAYAYLRASGQAVTVDSQTAVNLAARVDAGLDVRAVAEALRAWSAS